MLRQTKTSHLNPTWRKNYTVRTTQLDILNKPHSLADEMFQTLTQLNKHNEPLVTKKWIYNPYIL